MNRRFACGAQAARHPSPTAVAVVLLLSISGSGCSLFRPPPPTEPPANEPVDSTSEESSGSPSSETDSTELTLGEELEADSLLALGDTQLARGDSRGAARAYMRLVEDHPQSDEAARALFQLAMMQLDPSTPVYDRDGGVASLQRIGVEHAESPWAPAAALVLELTRQNADLERTLEALESQLDELKKLDLSADPSDG